ncbi:MAG TPA: UDP-glucose/GDP-mannose dehydrogenase family protein [bacterium]|nr:UDP-glucose/GDP-mannose dehydrogenase family protein [bacterium]
MELCVVGIGYVGLVTATCFADLGNRAVCVDVDKKKIDGLKKGHIPIFEPGLQEMVLRNHKDKRLVFTTSLAEGLAKADVVFIAVGTPSLPSGEANLEYVKEVARGVGRHASGDLIVVDKSTVPVGMGDMVESLVNEELEKRRAKHKVTVVSCPEFLREGSALYDFMNPDRIVIGSRERKPAEKVAELFKSLPGKKMITDLRSAEMIKYASNAFLATKISFINEIANLCERVDADVKQVAEGMGLDKRIGAAFLNAGAGYGGSCFPKDVSALVQIAEKEGYGFQILKSVIAVNEHQKRSMLARIKKLVGTFEGKTFGVLGLAFKGNTDDMRDAVSIDVIRGLLEKGARVQAFDPAAMEHAARLIPGIKLCKDAHEAAKGAHCLVVLTEWNEFKELDLAAVKKLLKHPVLVDGRNLYDPATVKKLGFTYQGVGRS